MRSGSIASLWSGSLFRKALMEGRLLLVSIASLIFGFSWLFVWLTSKLDLGAMGFFLRTLPGIIERVSAVPFSQMTTPAGIMSVVFIHPVIVFSSLAWAIARGSDSVSGEIGRGSMEMLLAQPVRRASVIVAQSVVTILGAAVLSLALLLGLSAALATVTLQASLSVSDFLLPCLNLFAFVFCAGGIATLCSSWDDYRWRTIGLLGGFIGVELILQVVARMWPAGHWLQFLTIFAGYEPQLLLGDWREHWLLSLSYNGPLFIVGLAGYLGAMIIFSHRDLPAPL